MYRDDVILWHATIWGTLAIQAVVIYSIVHAVNGDMFGYSSSQLFLYFGMTIFASGFAQCVVHGVMLHLNRVVHTGQFDNWLLQPSFLIVRMFIEDIGLIWFWPHLIVGSSIIVWAAPASLLPLCFAAALLGAGIEMGFMLFLSSFAIRWSMWNPEAFLWDYLEQARSIPVTRTGNPWLMFASFGVLQYSLALEVVTGKMSVFVLAAAAIAAIAVGVGSIYWNVRYYSSASG
jgi:ABC-type uncharacterized transport system permease subunit